MMSLDEENDLIRARREKLTRLRELGQERFDQLDLVDPGDFIGVEGGLFRTRSGEVTVEAADYEVLAKGLRPLPFGKTVGEEHHGDVTDVELRYRQRYADLAVHPEV